MRVLSTSSHFCCLEPPHRIDFIPPFRYIAFRLLYVYWTPTSPRTKLSMVGVSVCLSTPETFACPCVMLLVVMCVFRVWLYSDRGQCG